MIYLLAGDNRTSRYLEEILSHAGLSWRAVTPDALPVQSQPQVIVVSGNIVLDAATRGRIEEFVRDGAALVVSGGTAGLDAILGASCGEPREGYLESFEATHPVTRGLPARLHVFQASPLHPSGGLAGADLTDTSAASRVGAGVVVNHHHKGATVALAADIAISVAHIQLGRSVHEDGAPAPDGTGPIDDGYLMVDDGVVLSWEHDRIQLALATPLPECPGKAPAYPAGDTPWFGVPVADELRLLLLQAIAWAVTETGQPLASLGEWPDGLEAVGLISHDSDGNLDDGAGTALRLLAEADVHSTWCHMWGPTYPNRYRPETFPAIKDKGHELALHYNSVSHNGGAWGRQHLAKQAAFVRNEAGVDGFVSNKNHFLRWEGLVEFFHWLADEGIQADQTKGPNKKGNVGYPHGSSLPWFPLDSATGEFIDVLELPLQFQDLWLTTPYAPSQTTIAQAKRHHGVAHFLFHQIHLHTKPDVARAMLDIVQDGREVGLAWWTSAAINFWERRRRTVRVEIEGNRVVIMSDAPVAGAVLHLQLAGSALITRDGAAVPIQCGARWNQPTTTVRLDLPAGETILRLHATQAADLEP